MTVSYVLHTVNLAGNFRMTYLRFDDFYRRAVMGTFTSAPVVSRSSAKRLSRPPRLGSLNASCAFGLTPAASAALMNASDSVTGGRPGEGRRGQEMDSLIVSPTSHR